MTPAQTEWLQVLDKKAVLKTKLAKQEELKRNAILKVYDDMDKRGKNLYQGLSKQMVQEGSGDKMQTIDFVNRDQTKELDHMDQKAGYFMGEKSDSRLGKLFGREPFKIEEWDGDNGQKNFQEYQESVRELDQMALEVTRLEVPDLDENGEEQKDEEGNVKTKRLFSDEDLANELYDPLKRRGVIPETMIPDDYSETKEVLEGSFDAYAERLKSEKPKSWFAENKDLGIQVFRSLVSFGSTGVSLDSAMGQTADQLKFDPTKIKGAQAIKEGFGVVAGDDGTFASLATEMTTGAGFLGNSLDIAFDVGLEGRKSYTEGESDERGLLEEDKESGLSRRKGAPKLAGVVVAAVSNAIGDALVASNLGVQAAATFGSAVKAGGIAAEMQVETVKAANVTKMVEILGKGIEDTFTKLSATIKPVDPAFATAGTAAKSALTSAINAAEVAKALNEGKLEVMADAFTKAAAKVGTSLKGNAELKKSLAKKENQNQIRAAASKAIEEELNADIVTEPSPELINKHKREHKDHEPKWLRDEDTQGGFLCTTCAEGDTDARLFAGILDRKIAALKKEQQFIKWASTLGGIGFDVAANFIAPLAIGGALVRMAKNTHAAIHRWRDFVNFVEARFNMFHAASAFSAPVAQFIHNSEIQHMHYAVNAAMEGMKIVAAVLQCTPVAPVGVGISSGVAISQATEGILYEAKKRYDLESAWKTYKMALDNPENRRLGLVAMKKNPTLAKYAMAWGAVIKKDPLVADFMNKCDLNADSLKDPKANVSKVVSYLEARLPDDNTVVGRKYSGGPDWAPKDVKLTLGSWMNAKSLGESKADVKPVATRALEAALMKYEKSYPVVQQAFKGKTVTEDQVKDLLQIISELSLALGGYIPRDEDGTIHEEMDRLTEKFRKLAADAKTEVEGWKPKK